MCSFLQILLKRCTCKLDLPDLSCVISNNKASMVASTRAFFHKTKDLGVGLICSKTTCCFKDVSVVARTLR